ncbi:MAG: HAMP domain-containing sensor histidine kinase [Anaerolineales bacterium]|nr:HAMP domain-containing sensor histidine kinase [Anaerolineales bacterium]
MTQFLLPMFSSLRSRLWLSYALIIVTALGVVAMIMFVSLIRNPILYRQTLERLRAVQAVVMERGNAPQSQSISTTAVRASHTFNVRILLYSQDRQIILDTYADREVVLPFPERRILTRNTIPLARDENGASWLYTVEKLPDGSFLMVAAPRPRISILNVFREEFLPLILQGGLIALLLSLVVAFFFARWIADPLQKVVLVARLLPSEEIKPVETSGPHEVQELTRAFNAMIARMQAGQKSQREFVANVSHELKTPLTSVQGFAQAILDGTADANESRQQAAQVIYTESGRMHRMVLDLLDLARLDAGTADITMTPVNMPALLNAIAEKFSPQLQRTGVNIEVNVPSNLPAVPADGDRMAQVFTNLVDNALKFTPRAGLISLRASVENNEMLISVIDTGAGIPEESQAQIFERFYQADPARRGGEKHGAGLGLAIAYEIVQAHGGRISVRSRLGEGTTFDVFLPLVPRSADAITLRK